MEKAKLIMMAVSTVFVLLACGMSTWMAVALPKGDPNTSFFTVAAILCFLAFIWFGWNVWNLWKETHPNPPIKRAGED